MFGKKLGLGTGLVAALLVVAIEVPASAQRSLEPARQSAPKVRVATHANPPAWRTGLLVRSEALNRKYGLGTYGLRKASTSAPAWLVALAVRSDALNRKYGLGEYAVPKSE